MCKLTKKQPASLIGGLKKYLRPYVVIYELITDINLTAMGLEPQMLGSLNMYFICSI